MKLPIISVIVCAFNRKDYVNNAINSILNQTLDQSLYELIVVSNFEIKLKIDKNYNYINIVKTTSNKRLNLMVYGIKEAKGEILCFLDDDDLFSKDKLEEVLEMFVNNDKLGYLHNSFSLIDKNGNNVTDNQLIKLWKQARKDYHIPHVKVKRYLRKITNYSGLVNLSSMSIRSSIIDKNTLDYFENLPGNMDEFIFYELLRSNYDLLLSKNILSFYRLHNQNNSKPKDPVEMIEYVCRLHKSLEMINKLLEKTDFKEYGQMKLKYWSYKIQLLDENSNVSFKFLLMIFVDVIKYRTDYYLSLAFFSLYKFLIKKSPINLMKQY